MVDNRSAKLKAQVAANRVEKKSAQRLADGGMTSMETSTDLPEGAALSTETLPANYQDPSTQALEKPLIAPEDVLGGGIAAGLRAAGPGIARGAASLVADEAGAVPLMSSRLARGAPSLEPIQRIQQLLGHPVLETGTLGSKASAEALLKAANAAHEAGKLHPTDFQRVLQFVNGRNRAYAEGGVVEASDGTINDAPPPGFEQFAAAPTSAPVAPQDAPPPGFAEGVAAELEQAKYGTTGQQAIAGLEGLAQGVAGPLATAAELAVGVSPEGMRGREEANPYTHGIAEATGLIGSTLLPGGQGALLAKAGKGAALVSGLAHEIPGIAGAAAKIVAKPGIINQIGTEAVKGAFESALFQGGRELTERFRNDPNQTAETALVHMGLATAMGGVFGGAVGGILSKVAPEAAPVISELDRPAFEAGDLAASVRHSDALKPAEKASILDGIISRKEKAEAPAIKSAAKALGAPVLEGMVSDSKWVQRAEDLLVNGAPTYSGIKRQGLYNEAHAIANTAVDTALGDASRYTKAELGDIMKNSIVGQFKEENAPIAKLYENLKAAHETIPLAEEAAPAIAEGLKGMRELKLAPRSPEGQLLARTLEEIQALKTVDDVKWYKSQLTGSIQGKPVSSNERRIVGILADKLTDLEENSIERFAIKQAKVSPESYESTMNLIGQRKEANKQYAGFISKVGELSDQLGKGKVHGVQDAIRFITELTPETIVQRLSTTKDSGFRKFFAKEFPEQNALMQEFQKGALREGASKTGTLSPLVLFNQINKLEPEIQKAIFSGAELKTLNNAETYLRSFPKNFNPSGTSHAEAMRAFMASPTGFIVGNARDLALEQFIGGVKRSPQVEQAVHLAEATVKGDKLIDKSLKAFFSNAKESGPAAFVPLASAHRDKLSRLIDASAKDPSRLYSTNDNNPMPEYAKSFAETSARAVQYLAMLKAKTEPQSPLDSKRSASPAETAAYNRALDIAQQPLSVLTRMKQGTLTPADVTTIKTIYPNLYTALVQRVMTQVIDKTSKGEAIPYAHRLQLSLFVGQPLDSTMTGSAILSAQSKGAAQQPQHDDQLGQPPAKNGPQAGLNKLKGMPKAAQTPEQAREQRLQK